MAANKDIQIYRGDTYIHELRLKDSSNVAINIASMSFSASIKKSNVSNETTVSFTVEKTDSANGIVIFSLAASDTANIKPGTYVYDFQQTNGAVVTTLLTGKAVVQADIT